MQATDPHFLLFSTAIASGDRESRWRFVLQPVGGDPCLAVADNEPDTRPSRLELLAVVRGLEALDQPSRVTLVTSSRYVIRGIRRGLVPWRERSFRWERFGHLVPIRDDDLWQRVDWAMQFHQVECCEWREGGIDRAEWNANCPTADFGEPSRVEAVSPAELVRTSLGVDGVVEEPALVIVPRAAARRVTCHGPANSPWIAALARWRQAIFTQFAAFRRPAFTRAA